jgi:TatD DNase family protein
MRLVDSHSHIDVEAFDADRDAVLARARDAGVERHVVPGVIAATWPSLRAACDRAPELKPGYGLHPVYLADHRPGHLDALPRWLEDERTVCVGECGLDFFVESLDREAQYAYLRPQLALARDLALPVVLHARRAVEAIVAVLREYPGITGVVHSYGGSEEQARQLFKLGFMLGIGGPVTYERANRIRRVVKTMPLEFLLLETDSPDQPNATRRGERNEPARLVEVCECVAALRGVEPEAIAAATTANANRLFRLG